MKNFTIDDRLVILPCLQERKKNINAEFEQKGTIISNNSANGYITSDTFDKFWWKSNEDQEDYHLSLLGRKDDRKLYIPSFKGFREGSNGLECKNFNIYQKWKLYGQYFNSVMNNNEKENLVILMISHHNRLRGLKTNDTDALLPLKEESNFDAYANNFCLKITISNTVPAIRYEIVFNGFPDKGDLPETCMNTNTPAESNIQSGGGEYTYSCKRDPEYPLIDDLNVDPINSGLEDLLNNCKKKNKNVIIYLSRHGNSLHNQPTNLGMFDKRRLDSSLTILGMYQAKKMADSISHDFQRNNTKYLLCTSFLSRAQLTGLLIFKNIFKNIHLPDRLNHNLKVLFKFSYERWKKLDKNIRNRSITKPEYLPPNVTYTEMYEYIVDLENVIEGRPMVDRSSTVKKKRVPKRSPTAETRPAAETSSSAKTIQMAERSPTAERSPAVETGGFQKKIKIDIKKKKVNYKVSNRKSKNIISKAITLKKYNFKKSKKKMIK